jgi:glycerol-3-phosphate acyltransferase PlsY
VAAYLVGSFPTAALVARRRGHDPLSEGSGNPGATNVYRLLGRRAAVLVLMGDITKGLLAAGAGDLIAGRAGMLACGGAAVVGHCFPLGRWRHGGKGVATAAGLALAAFPLVALACAAVWIALAKATRKASLASLVAIAGVPVGAAITGRPAFEVAAAAAIGAVVIVRHGENVARLLSGDERSLH